MGFYLFTYFCAALFLLATGLRLYRQMILPVHVRWELYPVQHESTDKLAHGGSYMEEPDWWEKKKSDSLFNEILYMVPEILLIRGLWKENRRLWWVSFPFHFGLYLLIGVFGLLVLYALLTLWGGGGMATALLAALAAGLGWCGILLGVWGGVGLLYRRLADPELKNYASWADYFNLLLILLFFIAALLTALTDPALLGARAYVYGLITGGGALDGYVPGQSLAGGTTILLASLLVAYIPLTHMSHMYMKYFFYHRVKWDDAPNLPGGRIEAAVQENLGLKPTWSATHVDADGRKTWQEIAASAPKESK
jgi:nitrate reductase gamma subunit